MMTYLFPISLGDCVQSSGTRVDLTCHFHAYTLGGVCLD